MLLLLFFNNASRNIKYTLPLNACHGKSWIIFSAAKLTHHWKNSSPSDLAAPELLFGTIYLLYYPIFLFLTFNEAKVLMVRWENQCSFIEEYFYFSLWLPIFSLFYFFISSLLSSSLEQVILTIETVIAVISKEYFDV